MHRSNKHQMYHVSDRSSLVYTSKHAQVPLASYHISTQVLLSLCVVHVWRTMCVAQAHVSRTCTCGTWHACVCVCGRHDLCLMHTAGVPEISICQSGFSRWENFTVLTSIKINRHSIEMKGHSSHWRWH